MHREYSESRKRATIKYIKEHRDIININVQKGVKEWIKQYAESRGESLTAFILRAVNETMLRDQEKEKGLKEE